jgi:hypothetical protein
MLEDQAVGGFVPDPASAPSGGESGGVSTEVLTVPRPGVLPVPDPAVVDSARLRIAEHRLLSATQPARQGPPRQAEDIRAIQAVIDSVGADAARPASVLDVGAALAVLCDLRLYLDELEADLLDAAQQVDLGWDVIAAIIGIPADEAERRHRALRAQRLRSGERDAAGMPA